MDAVEETPAGVDLVINKPVDLKKINSAINQVTENGDNAD